MKVGVLTSTQTRHRFFARALARDFNVSAVIYEDTGYTPADLDGYDLTDGERRIVENHFKDRVNQEERFFGQDAKFLQNTDSLRVMRIQVGELNTESTLAVLTGEAVDVLAIFGTNLIKEPILSHFAGRMINMHLGLSPYYRGTGTNFYPLLNEEPEFVGATIHLIDPGIDSGPIIRHTRPEITENDRPHTIGCKAILAGIDAVKRSLADFAADTLKSVPQWEVPDPKLYLRKDYHPRQVVELYEKLKRGLISDYAKRSPKKIKLLD